MLNYKMFLYIVPVVVFLVISLSMYTLSKDKEKNKNILVRNILPAFVISVLVFVFMKYRETMFNEEPMMGGNYFDN